MIPMSSPKGNRVVITFGTYDLFHFGHLRLLERARLLGDTLVVGVSTDELNFSKKGVWPTMPFTHRTRLVAALKCVDAVFAEERLEDKRLYITQHRASVLVMGDDWAGKFDEHAGICQVVYLPRTPEISSTSIKAELASSATQARANF